MTIDQDVQTEFRPLVDLASDTYDSGRYLGLVREMLHKPDMTKLHLVPALAEMNIQFRRHTEPQDSRKYALTGATLNKASLEELVELRKKGVSDVELLTRLDEIMVSYTIAVALPRQIIGIHQLETANKFFNKFVSDHIKKEPYHLPSSLVEDYRGFEEVLFADAYGLRKGIMGELIVFCLLDKSGLKPRLSTAQEDMQGIDLHLTYQAPSGEKSIPVQVKSEFQSRYSPFKIDRLGKKILIAVNNHEFRSSDHTFLKGLISTDPKANPNTLGLFSDAIHDYLKSFV